MKSARCLFGLLFAALAAGPVQAAPAELKGKSIVIAFTENRVQRNEGWKDFRPVQISGGYDIYVSETGRVFSRLRLANRRQSGTKDRVGNTGGIAITFQGDMLVLIATQGNNARRIIVKFGAGFSTCEASVVRARQAGASTIKTESIIIPGLKVEIKSVEITGVSCRIQNGNVFSGG